MDEQPISAADSGTFSLGGDLAVHRLGFGAMRITGEGIWGPPEDRSEALKVLRRAIELGINLIDTANSYGPHVSEELIAEALHPYPADLVIVTKGGLERMGPDKWKPNGRPDYLRAELEGSLRRLKLDRIDLYLLHRVDNAVPEDEQFGAIAEWQREGLIRHAGLSEVMVEQVEQAQKFFPVVAVQNRYNVVDRMWESVVEHCDRSGIAFMPWFPLQAGTVSDALPSSQGFQVLHVAERLGVTLEQIALAWLLRRSPVILPIPGTSRVSHLEQNVAAAKLQLSDEDFASFG